MAKEKEENKKSRGDKSGEGFFIPGGIILGMGFGFLFNNVPAGMFIGLGLGFVAFGIAKILRK